MAKNTEKEEAESLDVERSEILDLQRQLYAMCEVLDQRYYATFEIEEAEAAKTENLETFTERFNALMQAVESRANEAGVALAEATTTVEDLQTRLTAIQSELDTLKAEKAEAELNAKVTKRETALAEIGISLDETNKEKFLEFSDAAFDLFVDSLKQVKASVASNKTTAEIKISLPDPVTSTSVTTEDLVKSHIEVVKKGK